MGRMPSRSTPRHLPQALALARSPHPVSFTFTLTWVSFTPSPSHCISVSPHLLHPRPRPFSHLPYHSPVSRHPLAISPLRHLPSSPSPLFPSLSPSPSLTLVLVSCRHDDPARSLAPRASLDLLPSPSRVASPLVLFARRVFVFLAPPSRHSAVAAPPPRLTSTPAQLCR
jgi:hypothetical protein